jgi:hypothetical protein
MSMKTGGGGGMRVTSVTVSYECECGCEYDVEVSDGCPAQLYGPPENCYPAEPAEVEGECPECGKEPDTDTVLIAAAILVHSWEEDKWEREVER